VFSSRRKIQIEPGLYDRLARTAESAGYATTEEYIVHVLERALSGLDEAASDEEVERRLRGLGYIE